MPLFVKGQVPYNKGKKHLAGKKHWNWKGGKKINSQGYILIWSPEHPYKDKQGYVREHRLIVEKSIGRYLAADEVVHHKNEIKNDNRLENLQLLKKIEHDKLSMQLRPRLKKFHKICPVCKVSFYVSLSLLRLICCSLSCGSKYRWKKGKIAFGR